MNSVSKLMIVLAVSMTSLSAFADNLKPVADGSRGQAVAAQANAVNSVQRFEIQGIYYKLVDMDSELNGDLTSTTMLMVGKDGVGGQIGFDAAFQLAPSGLVAGLKSAKVVGNSIEANFYNLNGSPVTQVLTYDAASQTLNVKTK